MAIIILTVSDMLSRFRSATALIESWSAAAHLNTMRAVGLTAPLRGMLASFGCVQAYISAGSRLVAAGWLCRVFVIVSSAIA